MQAAEEAGRDGRNDMTQKLLLDLFCCAGGAARGYQQAGFYVVGVDIKPQPHYVGDEFFQGDALDFVRRYGKDYYAIHASPPCQAHSTLKYVTGKDYLDLIPKTRLALKATGRYWIIENVENAPLINPVTLCGTMFNLKVFRHRKFETSFTILGIGHVSHSKQGARVGRCGHRDIDPSGYMSIAGHFSNVEYARKAMGIDWMTQGELAQAIPPAYTRWIGERIPQDCRLTL